MTDHARRGDELESAGTSLPASDDARESIEAYETEDGVVFYDARNPLAWLKATHTISLDQHA